MLYIVSTPIGNLSDITYRAVETLREVSLVLAEDTRTSKKLLQHFNIEKPLLSYHAHNEHNRVEVLVERLKSGESMALISDAGTPAISDPGFLLVRACKAADVKVIPIGGVSAVLTGLVASGIPCDKFHFEGFLPHKKGRQTRLKYLSSIDYTFVLYESPHRILKCLKQLAEYCGDARLACTARELTKLHEEILTLPLAQLISHFEENAPRGEFVIVVAGKD